MTLSEAATNHQPGINERIDWSCQLIAGPPIFGRAHMAIPYYCYKSNQVFSVAKVLSKETKVGHIATSKAAEAEIMTVERGSARNGL